jgi:hypothetical protein
VSDHGGMVQMSLAGRTVSVAAFRTPRLAARFILCTISRVTTTQPRETTTSRTQATVREGSRMNSTRGCLPSLAARRSPDAAVTAAQRITMSTTISARLVLKLEKITV